MFVGKRFLLKVGETYKKSFELHKRRIYKKLTFSRLSALDKPDLNCYNN